MYSLLALILSTVGVLTVLEGGARMFYERIVLQNGAAAGRVLMGDENEPEIIYQRHPSMLYVNRPGFSKFGFQQINSLGYRGREFQVEKELGTLRLLCLEGSTTISYPYVPNPTDTWSDQLGKILTRELGRPVEVINAGLNAATSSEALTHYLFRHRYL